MPRTRSWTRWATRRQRSSSERPSRVSMTVCAASSQGCLSTMRTSAPPSMMPLLNWVASRYKKIMVSNCFSLGAMKKIDSFQKKISSFIRKFSQRNNSFLRKNKKSCNWRSIIALTLNLNQHSQLPLINSSSSFNLALPNCSSWRKHSSTMPVHWWPPTMRGSLLRWI